MRLDCPNCGAKGDSRLTKLQDGGVALRAVTAAVVTNGTTYMIAPLALSVTKSSQV